MATGMNKWLAVALLILSLAACKSKRQMVPNSDEPILESKSKVTLLSQMNDARFEPQYFGFKGNGSFLQGSTRLPFQMELRLEKDKAIWADFADPILGIRLIRVFLTPDSAWAVNRIERTYYRGSLEQLLKLIGGEGLGFQHVQEVLLANFPEDAQLIDLRENLDGLLIPEPEVVKAGPLGELYQARITKSQLRPLSYTLQKNKRTLEVEYGDYLEQPFGKYPESLKFKLNTQPIRELELDLSQFHNELRPMPFSIPSDYKPMK